MIDLMVLYILVNHDFTMYAILKRIQEYFLAYTNPSFGALKPALVRLEKQGFITSSKVMSDGGKLSVFYAITKDGLKNLRNLMLKPMSKNPLQFISDAKIKLSCLSVLEPEDRAEVFADIRTNVLTHKNNAEKILTDEYIPLTTYQKIVLDDTVCAYKNFITMIDQLEKD